MKQRIQKVLAAAGVASRRNIEEMVREGRIAVNGKIVRDLPILIDPFSDRVEIDGETIKLGGKKSSERVYILVNKPPGVYSTNVAQGEQMRVIDLLPPDLQVRVFPVGRLDSESRGLILLTNDGELTNKLTHPRYGVPKTYRAIVDGFLDGEAVQALQNGIWLANPKTGKGFKTGRTRIRVVNRGRGKSVVELTIREGRNRQVRRMFAQIGHKVRELTRVQMGPLTLKGIGPGQFRVLSPREVKQLYKAASDQTKSKPSAHKSGNNGVLDGDNL
jgi:pseudouridine synthase